MDKARREEFLQSQSIQQFMTQLGMFVTCWGNFEVYLEVIYWHFKSQDLGERMPVIECCREFNATISFPEKCQKLCSLLNKQEEQEIIDAINRVIDVADRNSWIHGHVINPDEQFACLTRFRVYPKCGRIKVDPIS